MGSKRKLSRGWRVEGVKKGGVFGCEIQDGGHELKEKEMGVKPDS